jgi:hypothetical protein
VGIESGEPSGKGVMTIHQLLRQGVFGPEEIRVMVEAYENALHTLRLVDRTNPVTEIVAQKIIEIWRTGERDPHRIAALAFEQLGLPPAAE